MPACGSGLRRARPVSRRTGRNRRGRVVEHAVVDQETRLRGVAFELEAGGGGGFHHGREIHRRADVLQPGIPVRIGVRAVAVVADQGPAVALGRNQVKEALPDLLPLLASSAALW